MYTTCHCIDWRQQAYVDTLPRYCNESRQDRHSQVLPAVVPGTSIYSNRLCKVHRLIYESRQTIARLYCRGYLLVAAHYIVLLDVVCLLAPPAFSLSDLRLPAAPTAGHWLRPTYTPSFKASLQRSHTLPSASASPPRASGSRSA